MAGAVHKVSFVSLLGCRKLTVLKLAKLQSLAVYFDTDSATMAGLPYAEAVEKFTALVITDPHLCYQPSNPFTRFQRMVTGQTINSY